MTLVKAAINGGRTPSSAHRVPITPAEIANETLESHRAGADVVHFHARTIEGAQTISPDEIAAAVEAIRTRAPHVIIGTTTGLWCAKDPQDRYDQVAAWKVRPDFASVAFSEEGAAETAELVVRLGMQLESAVWSIDDVPALLSATSTFAANIRVLIEPEDEDPDQAVSHAREMATRLRSADITCPLLYHGYDQTVWPVLEASVQDGHQIRIGFEDGMTLPDDTPAATNADLLAAALLCIRQMP